jgi:hypothetical protein
MVMGELSELARFDAFGQGISLQVGAGEGIICAEQFR